MRVFSDDEADIDMQDMLLLDQHQQQVAATPIQLQVSVMAVTDVMSGCLVALAVSLETFCSVRLYAASCWT